MKSTVESHVENLDRYLDAESETSQVEFKAGFDSKSNQEWCELLKDVVAMANSGGGCIIIGRSDDGEPSGCDIEPILEVDPADFSNKVEKYTGCLYADFRIVVRKFAGERVACLVLGGALIPMVFTKPGTYAIAGTSQQKTAFAQGAVYFRHGAKSEPGTKDDLQAFVEREVSRIRSEWLENIRKVVEAPTGAQVVVVAHDSDPAAVQVHTYRLTADPTAPLVRELNPDDTHPHRQKDVARLVAEKLGKPGGVTPHDIYAVRKAYNIDDRTEYWRKPNFSSPRFSEVFVDWLAAEYRKDSEFFETAKLKLRKGASIKPMPANDDPRLQWLVAHMSKYDLNTAAVAKKLDVSACMVSQVLSGTYPAHANKLLQQIEALMEADNA